jgi:carbonic anhydrase
MHWLKVALILIAQTPFAIILGCADLRVVPELI